MEVRFRTRKLARWFERASAATRDLGPVIARKYVERINLIGASADFEELRQLPGLRCHPLRQDRNGQWSVRLTGQMRLIFTIVSESPEAIQVEEVSKHYGD